MKVLLNTSFIYVVHYLQDCNVYSEENKVKLLYFSILPEMSASTENS